jgi:hypothetical protein
VEHLPLVPGGTHVTHVDVKLREVMPAWHAQLSGRGIDPCTALAGLAAIPEVSSVQKTYADGRCFAPLVDVAVGCYFDTINDVAHPCDSKKAGATAVALL